MNPRLMLALCVFVLFGMSSCSPSSTPTLTPTNSAASHQIAPTATPINLTRSEGQLANVPVTQACTLVNRQDVGTYFHGEVNQPYYESNHVNQVIFAAPRVSAIEYYCVYMAFYLPGSKNGVYNQLTYWVDTPDQVTGSDWAQTWVEGKSHAAQIVPDVGDDAFYGNGRLTFKKDNQYVTIEVISTKFDTNNAEGVAQQLEIEKGIALTALNRITN